MQTKISAKKTTLWMCVTALLTAANVIMSMSIFSIPVPGGHLYLNDVIICTAAILLDPFGAFIVGGIGAFLGDMLFYPAPMFVSLVTHGLQAVVISLCTRHIFKSKPVIASLIGVILGAIIMVAGYTIGRAYIYSTKEYAVLKLPFQILQAAVGAVAGMLLTWLCGIKKRFDKQFPQDKLYIVSALKSKDKQAEIKKE